MRLPLVLALLFPVFLAAQEEHHHPAPEKLGTVSFQTSCKPEGQLQINRAVALLHSFAYKVAEDAFQSAAEQDAQCAIAHWGIAMTHYHQLWEPPFPAAGITVAQREIARALAIQETSERERGFIHALNLVFEAVSTIPYSARASNYEAAMRSLAATNPGDVEA